MTWAPERTSVNQRIQISAETTPGTAVPASKLIECFSWKFGVKNDTKMYTPTGRKYASTQEENEEWVEGTVDGNLDYNGLPYLLSSVFGVCTPVAHGSSATAKDWIMTPPVTGSVQPQTYSIEQGDSVRAHKFAYGLLNKFGYKFTRKDASCSGSLIGQALSDGITMTSNPTAVALAPIVGKMFNVYADSTSSALGTTQFTKVLSFDYSFDSVYVPFWPVNRANASFTAHVDTQPKPVIKLLLEADSSGMSFLSNLQSGATIFLRVDALGTAIASDGPGTVNNEFKHDMAVKVSNSSDFSDSEGIFAVEWELTVVEDSSWGKAQTATVTNLITAL
jgi:hypothetical protein